MFDFRSPQFPAVLDIGVWTKIKNQKRKKSNSWGDTAPDCGQLRTAETARPVPKVDEALCEQRPRQERANAMKQG
jgi:hypothetical protein